MMRRLTLSAAIAASLLALVACGEKPQEVNGAGVKQDNAPYQGVGSSQYANTGWKAGDKGSWEQQLKARAQYGQNDYTRMGNSK
jgi:predicted small lipoprotein YifL